MQVLLRLAKCKVVVLQHEGMASGLPLRSDVDMDTVC